MEETQHDNYPPAIWVRYACKQYIVKRKPIVILDQLNMTVPKGCIYGLLGASGCGKTTLLNCILNFKTIDSGKILVFGKVPGSKDSGIPGPLVGYMPQELALGQNMTILEVLKLFGWIAGLRNEEITQRTSVLRKLLSLPDLSNRINNLSGGEQRRVSLACTLIHQPDLLILDEPTVGLESILRKDIWDYLQQLSKKLITIIITTHYIEETRQADMVGFMRSGCILTEDSPNNVMRRFNEQTLEKVFLKLSIMQNTERHQPVIVDETNGNAVGGLDDVDIQSVEISKNANLSKPNYEKFNRIIDLKELKRVRVKAQLWKHLIWMRNNYESILFFFVLTFGQIVFFCLTIGHNPTCVTVSVYNSEMINCKESNVRMECNNTQLSCVYLKYLEGSIFKLTYYSSEKKAIKRVSLGKSYAAIIIKPNYTIALRNRIKKWIFASSYDLNQSEISVIGDNTNAEVSEYIILYLYKNFQTFLQNYLESCKLNKRFFSYPVRIEDAVYGNNDPSFTDYFLPGFIITLVLFLGIILTATSILTERSIGDLERTQVVGVKVSEIIFAYCVTELVLMVIVIFLIIFTVFFLFNTTLKGDLEVVICLCACSGLCGMSYGVFIASVCKTEFTAAYLTIGSLLPLVILSGIVWPYEGMHVMLQWIAYILPVYIPSEGFRSVMQRGWGWSEPIVYKGLIILSTWSLLFLLLSFVYFKFLKIK